MNVRDTVYTSISNSNKKKNTLSGTNEIFDRFWLAYPRHDDKKNSALRFHAAVKRGIDPEMIIGAAAVYAAEVRAAKTEKKFVKLASGWLLGERWIDYPSQRRAEVVQLTPERRAEILLKIRKAE